MNITSRSLIGGIISLAGALWGMAADAARADDERVFPWAASSDRPDTAGTPACIGPCSQRRFELRAELGEAVEKRAEFAAYFFEMHRRVGAHFAVTMKSCFATTETPATDSFTLVADVTSDGRAAAIEVNPATNIATCFASGVASAAFPPPPSRSDGENFPITIRMHIN